MLVPIRMSTNMAAGNQQKHLSLSFTTKACIYLSRNSKTLNNTFSNTRTVQKAKFPEISHFFLKKFKRGLSQNQEPILSKNVYGY